MVLKTVLETQTDGNKFHHHRLNPATCVSHYVPLRFGFFICKMKG